MKTSEGQKLDKNGYILVPTKFKDKNISFELVKVMKNGWSIYKRSDGTFELVQPYQQKEFIIAGTVIPKKWKYPSSEDWGKYGFTCMSVEHCEEIHKKRSLSKTSNEENC